MTALAQLPKTRFAAVSATALTRTYGDGGTAVRALRGVSLEVRHGEFLAIMGPSGAGKSTLLHLLAGLDTADAGVVQVAGEQLARLSDRELTRLRRQHIGFVFASASLLPALSAEANVLLPLAITGCRPDEAVVDALMERMRLAELRDLKPAQLSTGEQQRVALARTLISTPTVLFADEPTGTLDAIEGTAVLDLLRAATDEAGQTTVMVTHDPRAAARADRVVFLAGGRVVEDLYDPTEGEIVRALGSA